MFHNKLKYGHISMLVLATHLIMLAAIVFRGNYEDLRDIVPLAVAVFSLDIVYMIVIRFFYKQMTYTTDYLLLLILNCSVIFQSCFGSIGFAVKHYITCVLALVCCQVMFLLTRNHMRVLAVKQYLYLVLAVLVLMTLFLTGSRSMWIDLGAFSIQPSEFMKPVFVLLCATSIVEQHDKKKLVVFYVSREMIALTIAFGVIFVLQWWCRDLGSLPTFAAAYGCGIICRICYPRAKFSKGTLIFLIAVCAVAVAGLAAAAPAYVQDRLSVDIWKDEYGDGYQQCQALMAIAEGALFGKGPGYGKLIHVAAADTDIIFSTICEEWGFFVALLVIFFVVSLLILPMINKPRSYFHATMVMGVAAVFVVQMGLNIFGSCNLIPFTGVTIPFVSQGGSSMIVCGLLTGMLKAGQSPVFRRPEMQKQQPAGSTRPQHPGNGGTNGQPPYPVQQPMRRERMV